MFEPGTRIILTHEVRYKSDGEDRMVGPGIYGTVKDYRFYYYVVNLDFMEPESWVCLPETVVERVSALDLFIQSVETHEVRCRDASKDSALTRAPHN
jgi:hypothetical protein